jgi:hypothetical protein
VIFRSTDTVLQIPGTYNDRDIYIHAYWILNAVKEEWYVKGLGQVLNAWRSWPGSSCEIVDSMIYFRKGPESWGKMLLSAADHAVRGDIRIYPNPAVDEIRIELAGPAHQILGIDIVDAAGKRILTTGPVDILSSFSISLDNAIFTSGLYFAYIRTPEGYLLEKFIKR